MSCMLAAHHPVNARTQQQNFEVGLADTAPDTAHLDVRFRRLLPWLRTLTSIVSGFEDRQNPPLLPKHVSVDLLRDFDGVIDLALCENWPLLHNPTLSVASFPILHTERYMLAEADHRSRLRLDIGAVEFDRTTIEPARILLLLDPCIGWQKR